MASTRRQLLATGGTLLVAGCLGRGGGGPESTASPTGTPEVPADLELVDGTPTVRFPEIADGEVSVSEDLVVTYASPVEATFVVVATEDGTEVRTTDFGGSLQLQAAIPAGGPPTVYPAPVYREATGFEYRFYANEAFVDLHDWHVTAGTGNPLDEPGVGGRAAAFEPHYRHVHRDVVTADLVPDADADEPLTVTVLQYPLEELRGEEPDDLTGAIVFGKQGSLQTPPGAPQASFSVGKEGLSVTLTHRGGDTIDADNLVVRIDGSRAADQWADEHDRVGEGDSLTVDVSDAPAGADLELVWVSDDGSNETVLLVFPVG